MQLSALDHLHNLHAIAAGVAPAMVGKEGHQAYQKMAAQFLGIYNDAG
jgi:hypothetical protein